MLNYRRRKRQADENSNLIICKWNMILENRETIYPGKYEIGNENELMQMVQKIKDEVQVKANCIQSDWSIPIILEAIGRIYYGNQKENKKYGPFFKRALVYLWNVNNGNNADRKNLESLLTVIKLSYVLEGLYGLRRFFLIEEKFSFCIEDGYFKYSSEFESMINKFSFLIQGRGKRLRVADVNSKLMNEKGPQFLEALFSILTGEKPKNIDLFKETFYEKIPGIEDEECKKFWQSIFFRYVFYTTTLVNELKDMGDSEQLNPSITLFPEFGLSLPEGLFTQEIVQSAFWNKKWINSQDDEVYGNLIVERPVLRITPEGDFATCSVLIGDSINYFIESHILNYNSMLPKIKLPPVVFKNAISNPFEEMVISALRKLDFYAGHVTEEGIWKMQKIVNLNGNRKLYGEIDALAYNPFLNMALLIECKVLNDVRDYKSYRNIMGKLVDDNEGFQYKILEKSKWVNEALSNYYQKDVLTECILLTDIPIPIVESLNSNIVLTYYEQFISLIKEICMRCR